MSTPILGEIRLFAGERPPTGWAACDGAPLAVAQKEALFALLGTTFGGDGKTSFALPDLWGWVAVHVGQGPGLSRRSLGRTGGAEAMALTPDQLPPHAHPLRSDAAEGDAASPAGALPAAASTAAQRFRDATDGGRMATASVAETGVGDRHDNMAPFVAVTPIIALTGVYPSRA